LKRQGKICVNDDSKISGGRGFHVEALAIDCGMVNGAFPPAFEPRRLESVGALVEPLSGRRRSNEAGKYGKAEFGDGPDLRGDVRDRKRVEPDG
jgi:hypothetical protein